MSYKSKWKTALAAATFLGIIIAPLKIFYQGTNKQDALLSCLPC